MDHTKEELVRRLQSTNQEKISEEHTTAVLNSDLQSYKREMLLKDQEIADLRRSIEQLDAAKDELQGELDVKTEEVAEARAQMERQQREYTQMQHQMSAIVGKEDGVARRMGEREQEIKTLRGDYNGMKAAMEEARQIAQAKAAEVQELVEDIQTLTRENKFVNTEFTKAT